jgi:Ankyrin repeats (3 copies)/Ankyrin repeat
MDVVPLPPRPDIEQYARDLAAGRVERWRAAIPAPASEFVRESIERAIAGALRGSGDAESRLAYAHGFDTWEAFVRHVAGEDRAFEAAADAVVGGEEAAIDLDLVHARSTRRHHATLLHYVAANGVEDFRQLTPPNAVEIARRLLDAGADVDALADTYGGGPEQTTINLLVSSAHPAEAGVQSALVELLLDRGAAIDGLENDCSPLMTALGFGYLETAETLVRRGARVDNIAAAAALGRLDLVRDHTPTDQALIWAAKFGRTAVVEVLLDHGADITAREDLMPLHWAAAFGHLDTIDALLARGAPLEARNVYGGTVLDSTLWFVFNAPVPGVDYPSVIRRLIAAGARTDVHPGMPGWIENAL